MRRYAQFRAERVILMMKAVPLAAGTLAAALIALQWPDISRYVKIKQMSFGSGHPGNVPAHGRTSYPSRAGTGAAEGTGDFDSASRGGPDTTR
jgi:hypothetical protein